MSAAALVIVLLGCGNLFWAVRTLDLRLQRDQERRAARRSEAELAAVRASLVEVTAELLRTNRHYTLDGILGEGP